MYFFLGIKQDPSNQVKNQAKRSRKSKGPLKEIRAQPIHLVYICCNKKSNNEDGTGHKYQPLVRFHKCTLITIYGCRIEYDKNTEQKIIFFDRYIAEKSVFDRHREEKAEEKSVKSPIFCRKIEKYRFFHRKIATVEHARLYYNF